MRLIWMSLPVELLRMSLTMILDLLHRPSPKGVPGGEYDGIAPIFEVLGDLGDGGGLSGPINPHEDDLDGLIGLCDEAVDVEVVLREDLVEGGSESFLDDLTGVGPDLLLSSHQLVLDGSDDRFGYREGDVAF